MLKILHETWPRMWCKPICIIVTLMSSHQIQRFIWLLSTIWPVSRHTLFLFLWFLLKFVSVHYNYISLHDFVFSEGWIKGNKQCTSLSGNLSMISWKFWPQSLHTQFYIIAISSNQACLLPAEYLPQLWQVEILRGEWALALGITEMTHIIKCCGIVVCNGRANRGGAGRGKLVRCNGTHLTQMSTGWRSEGSWSSGHYSSHQVLGGLHKEFCATVSR